jgi:acyl carrier protein
MDIQETLIQFIEGRLASDQGPRKVAAGERLFGGLLDSLDILRLVTFIEEEFGIRVQDDELVPENFETARHLADYIRRKSEAGV